MQSRAGSHERSGPNPGRGKIKHDYELVADGLDCNSAGSKVLRISLTHNRGSVQLRMVPRDDPDDIGYAVVMTNESARVLGEALIKHAAAS